MTGVFTFGEYKRAFIGTSSDGLVELSSLSIAQLQLVLLLDEPVTSQ